MSGSIRPISSAVVLPEPAAQSPPGKRRQSSNSNVSSKRPRLSHDGSANSPPALSALPQAINANLEPLRIPADEKVKQQDSERLKSSAQEEKKRGRRLFGGLLSTLSQTLPSGHQKRRLEIEKRQTERARQQKGDDELQRREKLAKIKAVRRAEQIKYNKESIRIRHSNILAMANFLCTKTEPKLYYKPWKLLPEEEARIQKQISEVQALIERELDEFDKLYPEEPSQEAPTREEKANISTRETVGEPHTESPPISNVHVDPTNLPVEAPPSDQTRTDSHSLEEHNGEVIVEAEEDTVIY